MQGRAYKGGITVTDFLTLAYLKASLSITTDNADKKLLEILQDSNNEVDKAILPFAPAIPVEEGTDLFLRGMLLATIYARARWLRDNAQLQRAEKSQEEYERKKESLVETLKAERNTRTKRVSVGTDYRTRRLFSQAKRY